MLGRVEEARDTLRETVEVTAGVNTAGLGQAYALYSLSLMEALMNDSDAALRRARESYDLRKNNGALETTVASYPYPPSVVEGARALREKFDATPATPG